MPIGPTGEKRPADVIGNAVYVMIIPGRNHKEAPMQGLNSSSIVLPATNCLTATDDSTSTDCPLIRTTKTLTGMLP
jgi:hypothetical protein